MFGSNVSDNASEISWIKLSVDITDCNPETTRGWYGSRNLGPELGDLVQQVLFSRAGPDKMLVSLPVDSVQSKCWV
jgi:hypothetical protein